MVETTTITKNPKKQAAGRLNVQKRTVNPVKVNGYFKILVPTILHAYRCSGCGCYSWSADDEQDLEAKGGGE